MGNSRPFQGRKGPNPEQLRVALAQKEQTVLHQAQSLSKLAQMVNTNCGMIGQMVVMFEVMKDKGLVTNEEINAKFKKLEEEREAAAKEKLEVERKILADNSLGRDTDDTEPGNETVATPEAKSDSDSTNPEGSVVQPKEAGSDESNQ